jgi:hypothetical protein
MSFIQTCQIHAWLGYPGGQLGDEVQRAADRTGQAIARGDEAQVYRDRCSVAS